MKKENVHIGHNYRAKVSGKVVPVRILRESPSGGWYGRNLETNREIRIKTAARLQLSAEAIVNILARISRNLAAAETN